MQSRLHFVDFERLSKQATVLAHYPFDRRRLRVAACEDDRQVRPPPAGLVRNFRAVISETMQSTLATEPSSSGTAEYETS